MKIRTVGDALFHADG